MRAGSKSSSQTGEVLAITLLNNANLSDFTLKNAKLRYIGMAEERFRNGEQDRLKISVDREKIVRFVRKMTSCFSSSRDSKGGLKKKSLNKTITSFNQLSSSKNLIFQPAKKESSSGDITKTIVSTGLKCILRLDEAVVVLRYLAQTSGKL